MTHRLLRVWLVLPLLTGLGVWLLLPLLAGLACGPGAGPQPADAPGPDPRPAPEGQVLVMPPEVSAAFAQKFIGPAIGEYVRETLKEIDAAFERTDDVERSLHALPGNGADLDGKFLAACVVRPDAPAGRRRLYDYKGVYRYARVGAPAAYPLAVFVARSGGGDYRVVQEATYDPSRRQWAERPGALREEREEVREAVVGAVKQMVPEGVKVAGLP